MRRAGAAAIVIAAVGAALALGRARRNDSSGDRCGPGFVAQGPRCVAPRTDDAFPCPPPLVATERGCNAPIARVLVPAATIAIGPSDWEAEGRVRPRSFRVDAFRMDAFEVTHGEYLVPREDAGGSADLARAAGDMTLSEAGAFCASRGGRLPTEDEWIVAAGLADGSQRRYPWGDTGAVCRRAAWGLEHGPCAEGASGPDTVGSHLAGDSPLGIHDLAGNVAEWVTPSRTRRPDDDGGGEDAEERAAAVATMAAGKSAAPDIAPNSAPDVAKGGSWQSSLASDLRIWARLELPPESHDARVGFRCVYAP